MGSLKVMLKPSQASQKTHKKQKNKK